MTNISQTENFSNKENIDDNEKFTKNFEEKIVITDTSSLLLSGPTLLKNMKNCTIIIPAIVVRELENKRSDSKVGFLARQWLKLIEQQRLKFGKKLSQGVELEEYNNITLRIEPNHTNQETLPKHLRDGSHDSTILAVAKNIQEETKDQNKVVLLSNDTPMRIYAEVLLEIKAYEYNLTQILGSKTFNGKYTIKISEHEATKIAELNKDLNNPTLQIILEDIIYGNLPENFAQHSLIQLTLEETNTNVIEFIYSYGEIKEIERKNKSFGLTPKNLEQDVAMQFLKASPDDIPIVSLGGSAGSGKTLITIAAALEETVKQQNYQKIIVFRSLHEMGNKQELGFLPGSVEEKMSPWAGAIYDALDVIATKHGKVKRNDTTENANTKIQNVSESLREHIEISPITYLRGRSLSNTFLILEEAQNFSRNEILNIISRAGIGSKIVLTFDSAQVDNRFLKSGDDADVWSVIDRFKKEPLFAHITLSKTERSKVAELAARIIEEG